MSTKSNKNKSNSKSVTVVVENKKTRRQRRQQQNLTPKAPPMPRMGTSTIRGQGDYNIKSKNFGGAFSQFAGQGVTELLGNIFGKGDYSLHKKGGDMRSIDNFINGRPAVNFGVASGGKSCRFTNDEYICDITATTGTQNNAFYINPGNSLLFPILSYIASRFSKYIFHKLVFEIRSLALDASTSLSAGKVVIVTNYDPAAGNFPTVLAAESYQGSVTEKPNVSMLHGVECANRFRNGPLFVTANNNGSTFTNADYQLHFMGLLNVFNTGQPSSTGTIAEIRVHYDVELFDLNIGASSTNSQGVCHYTESPSNSASASNYFGSSGAVARSGSDISYSSLSGNILTLSVVGRYAICWVVDGSVTANSVLSLPASNITALNIFDGANWAKAAVSSSASVNLITVSVATGGIGALNQITLSGATGLLNGHSDMFIFPIPITLALPAPPGQSTEQLLRVISNLSKRVDDLVDFKAQSLCLPTESKSVEEIVTKRKIFKTDPVVTPTFAQFLCDKLNSGQLNEQLDETNFMEILKKQYDREYFVVVE